MHAEQQRVIRTDHGSTATRYTATDKNKQLLINIRSSMVKGDANNNYFRICEVQAIISMQYIPFLHFLALHEY